MLKYTTRALLPATAAIGIMFAGVALGASTTGKGANPNGKPFLELNGEILEIEGEISTLQDQVEALIGQVDTLEAKVTANMMAIADLEDVSADLQVQIDASADDIASLEIQVTDLEADNASLQAQIDDLGDADGALQADIDANNALITTLNQSLSDLSITLQDQIDNNNDLIALLQDEIDLINDELAEKQNLVDGFCPDGSAIKEVLANGDVVCEAIGTGTTGTLQMVTISSYRGNTSYYRNLTSRVYCPSGYLATGAGWHGHDARIDDSRAYSNYAYVRSYSRYDFFAYAMCARIVP